MPLSNMALISGTANTPLFNNVVRAINKPSRGGSADVISADVETFNDGESRVELFSSVRGKDVFVMQSTCAPANHNVMELMVLVDAIRRSSAGRIIAVMPYFGYARQDRRPGLSRVPISSRLIADMLEAAGVDHVITFDLHAAQIQGFFKVPTTNISATQLISSDIYRRNGFDEFVVVSPDVGGVARARAVAKQLDDASLAIIDKRRPKAGISEVMNIIGDVDGKTCFMVDDIIDTAGTLCKAAAALKANGAERVVAYCTHPVLSGPALDNLNNSELDELSVTDTIPLSSEAQECSKIRQFSIASILAETLVHIHTNDSVSRMFME